MSVGQNIFEKNKIYHGDCLEMMKQIPDKSINLVVVDLPYNIGKAYKSDLEWISIVTGFVLGVPSASEYVAFGSSV